MNSTANRSRIRNHKGLVVAGAALVLSGAGAAGLSAVADPVDSNIAASCAIGTSKMDVTVPLTVDDKVDPIAAGAQETLETKTGFPSLPVEVTIDKLVVTEPVPEQIASTDSVTFTGGNVTGSYEISGSNLVVTFTGPVSSKDMQVPLVTAKQTLKDGIAPTTIEWKTFSQIVADTNYGQATCTPNDPNQTVNTTSVVAAESPTPTTSPTTNPPSSTPPTTSPTPTTTTPPAGTPGLPAPIPGLPVPDLPVPAPGLPTPSLPAPPAVPSLPAPPSLPTPPVPDLPAPPSVPGLPGGATGPCPTLPVPVPLPAPPVPCPAVPAIPAPTLPAPPTLPGPTPPGASAEVGVQVKVSI